MPSSQVQPPAQGPPSLIKGSRAEGSADEVLVIALAALTYDKRCGGEDEHGRSLEDVMQAVDGFSRGYVEGDAWATPEAWRRGDNWIVAYLRRLCSCTAVEVANTISAAFGAAVVAHGGGVQYEPTRANLSDYFSRLARPRSQAGWLAGVPHGARQKDRPLRLLYLAPRVVALLRASHGALEPLVDEAYDFALGAEHKAESSAKKCVLKAQLSALSARTIEIEMEADEAREAADEQSEAASAAAAELAAERRSRAQEVRKRVDARTQSARERGEAVARERVAADCARVAKRLRTEKATSAGLRASCAAKERKMLKLRESSPAALLAAQKERTALNRRIRRLELELDNSQRDAAAARADAAAARAAGAADRAKIDTLRIPKVNLRTRTQRTRARSARAHAGGLSRPPGRPFEGHSFDGGL